MGRDEAQKVGRVREDLHVDGCSVEFLCWGISRIVRPRMGSLLGVGVGVAEVQCSQGDSGLVK